ncbi:UNKNOWN [Stylonychia lemnae]|uniref:Lipase-like C-terminal domain-containing protein n=1 Tax=Stylonychia lemnae TaxID=5949 RepID=A0A078ATS0_STYLE|nr:UNKNOWN [Stylonychia lemnae]|eukprot:CDW85644.1 UNKNOWN [Stylonychia lemnae]
MLDDIIDNMDPKTKEVLQGLALGVGNSLLLLYIQYQSKKNQMIKESFNNPDAWRNDYPIILVHGYCGCTMDENWILGGYFHYAFSYAARYLNLDHDLHPQYLQNVFEADVSPIGSVHDRACELYQQIVGKFKMEEICQKRNISMAEAVYGKQHVDEHHQSQFYKIRYLKTQDPISMQMFAFPNGIPGWKETKDQRIHFVGHSMGAITIRYLQYLLKTGYFDQIEGTPIRDRSDIVASLTCLSGANNGTLVVNNCGLQYDRELSNWVMNKNAVMMRAFKMHVFCQNFFNSQNFQQEKIKKVLKQKNGDKVYQLNFQLHYLVLYDLNVEMWDWNRRTNESLYSYWKRLQEDTFQVQSKDLSFVDLNPAGMIQLNTIVQSNPNTYYFSITNGYRDNNTIKSREILRIHKKITDQALGYKIDMDEEIALNKTKMNQYNKKEKSWWDQINNSVGVFIKYLSNPIFSHLSFFYETQTQVDALQRHLSNYFNPNMNNVDAADYVNKDWTEDNDFAIARKSSEFPRMTNDYHSLLDQYNKPWGHIGDPQIMDFIENPIFQKDYLRPGVWYFGGVPRSDHLDFCGIPPKLHPIRTLLGREYRIKIWRNIYSRLKMLKFDEIKA